MRRMHLAVLGVGALLGTAAASAATLCVDPDKASCFATIQEAVDAADPGDRIKVAPHPDSRGYRENVVVDEDGLEIVGVGNAKAGVAKETCPKTIVDGCESAAHPTTCSVIAQGDPIFRITAADVTLSALTIRHGYQAVRLDGVQGASVEKSCFIGNEGSIVSNGQSDGATVTRSVFRGSIGAVPDVQIEGDDVALGRNTFLTVSEGLEVVGDSARVERNLFEGSRNKPLIVEGHEAVVHRNIMRSTAKGPSVSGDQPDIQKNQVFGTEDDNIGVDCGSDPENPDPSTCTGGLIAGNLLRGNNDDDQGIRASGNNLVIRKNRIELISEEGIEFEGDDARIEGNKILRVGTENTSESAGIMVVAGSDGNEVVGNKVKLVNLAGIQIGKPGQTPCNDNLVRNNKIDQGGRSGVWIVAGDGNVVEKNVIKGNQGEGIANAAEATNTVIQGNKLSRNRNDVCNDGNIATFAGNKLKTGGESTACLVQAP